MKTTATFLKISLLLLAIQGYGQQLRTPQLGFEFGCVSTGHNNFQAKFSFEEKPFNANNVFYIELSDQYGNFDKPTVLKTVKDENYSFEFNSSFELPEEVAGEGYQIRLRSTSPVMVSNPSSVFDAYFVSGEELILNEFQDVSLCGGGSSTISLNSDVAEEYVWYKDGELYKLTQDNKLAVSTPGEYYVEPYYGNCTGSNYSNLVIVEKAAEFDVAIQGTKDAEDCSATTLTLTASVSDENYKYSWFKNDKRIDSLTGYFPSISLDYNAATMGKYNVQIAHPSGCVAISNTYSFEQNKGATVEANSPLNAVIIGNHLATLSIKTNSESGKITWYKDGEILKEGVDSTTISVADQGDYYALVGGLNPCDGVTKSQTFKIYKPQSYEVEITPDRNYKACIVENAKLSVRAIKGVLGNGDRVTIAEDFYNNFELNWFSGEEIVANGTQLNLNYTDNGTYTLQLSYEGKVYDSNTVEVVLGLPEMQLEVEKELSCTSSLGVLTLDHFVEGAVYKWYKDGSLIVTNDLNSLSVSSAGVYQVEVSYNGCSLTTTALELNQKKEGMISLYPGELATIGPSGVIQANATGGSSYKWISEQGDVLSEASTLTIDKQGIYTLVAKIGSCVVEKDITVNANLVEKIPNIVSPNNDTVNDKWTLPQNIIDDPETEVIICDAYGATVLKTTTYDNSWPSSTTEFSSQTPVFYYFINKKGKNVKKGSITLVN